MQILFHQFHFFYLLNDTKIILFGSKLTKKSELTYYLLFRLRKVNPTFSPGGGWGGWGSGLMKVENEMWIFRKLRGK